MKLYWKIIIGIGSLIMLIIILEIGLNLWIKYQFPKILNEKNDSSYFITYKTIDVSLLHNTIKAEQIVIVPKAALRDTLTKAGLYAKVKSINVADFKILSALLSNHIEARSITVNDPEVVLYKKNEKAINSSKSIGSAVVAPFRKVIAVSDIFLNRGNVSIVFVKNNKTILSVQNINLQLEGIAITDAILEHKIPFSFKKYNFSCDSIYYRLNEFYHIKTHKITTTLAGLGIDHFEMIPEYSRVAFVKRIPKQKDLFTLQCHSMAIKKMNWGFKSDDFFFHADEIVVNKLDANIYRSLLPPNDLSPRKLYNQMLRELKFDLKINRLRMRNSIIEYEEEKSFEKGPGKLTFSHFNMMATNIRSGFKQKKMADLKIKVKCTFMNASPLDVNWRLNVMDLNDGFQINGTIVNFDVEKIIPFTKPYINITAKGSIDELHFNFTGNSTKNSGGFAIKYDDLKLAIYKKNDRQKKNKLLTFIGNLFVKNDTKNKMKEAHVEVERVREKSFFNFLWRSIAEGLKKTLL